MKKLIATAMTMVAVALVVVAIPTTAQASIKSLAKQECKEERATDTREFRARYGGTGKKALRRCIKAERADARADCREDRREEPNEFIRKYGGKGKKAIKRCMRDELR
jgi:hypothetical protein